MHVLVQLTSSNNSDSLFDSKWDCHEDLMMGMKMQQKYYRLFY